MLKNYFCLGVSLLCLGCSVGPDYHRPDKISDEQIAKSLELKSNSTNVICKDWYKQFNDQTLTTLIEKGITESPTVKIALSKMKQARYQLFINRAGFLPVFNLQGTYENSKENTSGNLSLKNEYYLAGLDASWEIDIWGGQRRLTESSKALLRSASADYENVKLSLIAEIATEYVNWRLAQKKLEIVEKNLKLQREIFETVKEQYTAGLTDTLAYEQAQSVLHTTEMKLPQLKTQEKSAQNSLSVLTGELPHQLPDEKTNLLDTENKFDMKLLSELPADIVRHRPDVRAAEQKLIAQNALIGKAIADLFPSVSITALIGYQNKKLSPLIGSNYDAHSNSAIISMPLLHWGALINQVKIQKESSIAALEDYQNTLLSAAADINNATISVKEEKLRNKAAKASMKSTSEILKLSLQKYKNGLIDFSDVLTAEQNKLSAEQEYLQSTASIYLNIIGFFKAVGGGFSLNRSIQACQTDETTAVCAPYTN